jgi:hypothetical protein
VFKLFLLTVGMAAFAPPTPPPTPLISPEILVQLQVDAYNAHDLDSMVACYSPAVEFWSMDGKPQGEKGTAALRQGYAELFAKFPKLKVKVLKRISQGAFVIDQVQAEGMGPEPITVTAIYETALAKIVRVWYIQR